ncbi:MAG: hypothetical protein JWN62_1823 [Acidimicrobiales bacterium]|nr:hypothetical protein [Acidimicrobiales bacterium]
MPNVRLPQLTVDFSESGSGPGVVLVHSSVSGNRQWRSLSAALAPRFRVIAVNLLGYGETTAFAGDEPQTLEDQLAVVSAVCELVDGRVRLVGHSFGGAVALAAAKQLGDRVEQLVLLEPNPFRMLEVAGRIEAFDEAAGLYASVKSLGSDARWAELAELFADYFSGDGTWASMPEDRRRSFAAALPPNFHEWDAVMNDTTTPAEWGRIAADVLLVGFGGSRRSLKEIVEVFAAANPHWSVAHVAEGGHMAPLTRSDLVNPVIEQFLR